MKQFLKVSEVQLVNGGYLSNADSKPVFNAAFVDAQKHAEYIITFAAKAKGLDFVGKKPASLADLEKDVRAALTEKENKFVSGPEAPVREITTNLANEAMAFMSFQTNSSKTDKINSFLQQFSILHEFEEFGLFFEEDIVKLNKIYTMEEVVDAVTSVIDLLK
jgi:hypothetical protein